jgi:hypothetical protein
MTWRMHGKSRIEGGDFEAVARRAARRILKNGFQTAAIA